MILLNSESYPNSSVMIAFERNMKQNWQKSEDVSMDQLGKLPFIMNWLVIGIGAVTGWFFDAMNAVEGVGAYIGVLSIWLAYRYIIAPAIGGSDEANANRKKKGDE